MEKERYVTDGLLRIKDQIAEAARKSSDESAGAGTDAQSAAPPPVSPWDRLKPETQQALLARRDEYQRFRQDLFFKLHELAAACAQEHEAAKQHAGEASRLKNLLDARIGDLEGLDPPEALDVHDEEFQMRLGRNCRALDRIRLDAVPLGIAVQKQTGCAGTRKENRGNLFAELDSVSFGQMFRIGAGLFLPLILALIIALALLGAAIVLTFRLGL